MSNSIKTIALILGITLSIFAINFAVLAWVGPPGDPTHCPSGHIGCNIPLHEGTDSQVKGAAGVGALGIEGVFRAYSNLIVDGDVGIGTTNPSQKLHVVGNIYTSGDISAPNNSWGTCTYSSWSCNDELECAAGTFMVRVGRNASGVSPQCGSGSNLYYQMRIRCCQL